MSTFTRPAAMRFSAAQCIVSLVVASLTIFTCGSANAVWYRGNIHCHTTNSDGNLSTYDVCKFYYDRGYSFVAITDHNQRTNVSVAQGKFDSAGQAFRILYGEEVSKRDSSDQSVHTNGINLTDQFNAADGTIVQMYQSAVNGINSRSGVAMINHPLGNSNVTASTLASITGVSLVEFFFTDAYESMWDNLLSRNRAWYAVGTDDTHAVAGKPERWIWVNATSLTASAIESALRAGDFYASNGIKLNSVTRASNKLSLSIAAVSGHTYKTTFIGKDGAVLASSTSLTPSYTMTNELYVRAKVVDNTTNVKAVSQPYFRVVGNTINDGPVCSANWTVGTSATDKYGPDYKFRLTAAVSDTAKFTVNLTAAGSYDISAWWSQGVNRCTSTPYIMPDGAQISVNQQINGGKWNVLATKSLGAGSQVVQVSCWTTTGYVVIADAIKLYGPK